MDSTNRFQRAIACAWHARAATLDREDFEDWFSKNTPPDHQSDATRHACAVGFIYRHLGKVCCKVAGMPATQTFLVAEHIAPDAIDAICAWLGAPAVSRQMEPAAGERQLRSRGKRMGGMYTTDHDDVQRLINMPDPDPLGTVIKRACEQHARRITT